MGNYISDHRALESHMRVYTSVHFQYPNRANAKGCFPASGTFNQYIKSQTSRSRSTLLISRHKQILTDISNLNAQDVRFSGTFQNLRPPIHILGKFVKHSSKHTQVSLMERGC